MSKKRVILAIIIVLLIVLGVIGLLYFNQKKDGKKPSVIKQVDKIEAYNYTIKETDSKLKKEKFKELKEILGASEIDYDAYASKLAELFVIDVYDLDSKINKYDVGGLEYVLEDKKESLKTLLQDTLYSNIKDNIDKDRDQVLPVVTKADAKSSSSDTYTYNGVTYDSYNYIVSIDYEKDLGYDKSVSVKMIKIDNKLFVVVSEPN